MGNSGAIVHSALIKKRERDGDERWVKKGQGGEKGGVEKRAGAGGNLAGTEAGTGGGSEEKERYGGR